MASIRQTADKLDDAFSAFAHENGDGFHGHDFTGACDYREEGYRLGEQAYDLSEEDRDDFIEGETYAFPESARYLIGCAADFRLAELVAEEAARPVVTAEAA